MIAFILWLLLLVVCWPLALAALILYPIIWLIPARVLEKRQEPVSWLPG